MVSWEYVGQRRGHQRRLGHSFNLIEQTEMDDNAYHHSGVVVVAQRDVCWIRKGVSRSGRREIFIAALQGVHR